MSNVKYHFMKKFFLITTIPISLSFFEKQISEINKIFDVTLVSSPGSELKKIADTEKVKFRSIAMKREISLKDDILSFSKFLWLFSTQRPDVIHCNTPKASLLSLVAGYMTRTPNRIYYIHGLRYEGATGKKRKLLKNIEKLNCFCATHIIAVSNGVKQKVEQQLTSKQVDVINYGSANGMDIDSFQSDNYDTDEIRKAYDITKEDFVFGFVGRLVGDKGVNELVNAFNKLEQKNIKLLLVGRYENELDPLDRETINLIKNNKKIIEVGFQTDVKKFLSIMDLFVSPSYREGFGLSVLEANLMKIPALVTNITGYSEIINEGKNGFFVEPKTSEELFKKMSHILRTKEKLKNMKQDCFDEVANKYNRKEVLKKALEYYSQFA